MEPFAAPIIAALKKHKESKAITLLQQNRELLDISDPQRNTWAHWAIFTGSGTFLSFLVNTINETSITEDDRQARLIAMFEAENYKSDTAVNCAIRHAQYNFLVFLLQNCCPSGNKLLTTRSAFLAVDSGCSQCLEYVLKNALNRIGRSANLLWLFALFDEKKSVKKYLDPIARLHEKYAKRVTQNDSREIIAIIEENPRLAWDSLHDDVNIAAMCARQGNIPVLDFIHRFTLEQPFDDETKERLLLQTFESAGWRDSKYNAVEFAVRGNEFETLKFLLEYCCPSGTDLCDKLFDSNDTLLHQAAEYGSVEMVRYILRNSRSVWGNLNMKGTIIKKTKYGFVSQRTRETPLEAAQRARRYDIVNYLETLDVEQLQRESENGTVHRARQYLSNRGDGETLPELMLEVMEQEMEMQSYRHRR